MYHKSNSDGITTHNSALRLSLSIILHLYQNISPFAFNSVWLLTMIRWINWPSLLHISIILSFVLCGSFISASCIIHELVSDIVRITDPIRFREKFSEFQWVRFQNNKQSRVWQEVPIESCRQRKWDYLGMEWGVTVRVTSKNISHQWMCRHRWIQCYVSAI